MAKDYENKQADLHASANDAGADKPALEDPLLELARIVQKNKETGTNVTSGRVGNTDYFAGLDDFAADVDGPPKPEPTRVEPSFAPLTPEPEITEQNIPPQPRPQAPVIGEIANQFIARPRQSQLDETPRGDAGQSGLAEAKAPGNVSPLWPKLSDPQPRETPEPHIPAPQIPEPQVPELQSPAPQIPALDPAPKVQLSTSPAFPVEPLAPAPAPAEAIKPAPAPSESLVKAPVISNKAPGLAPDVALDLEQNLTAELEDELIGALRQSVDEDLGTEDPSGASEPVESDPFAEITEPEEPVHTTSPTATDSFAANDRFHFEAPRKAFELPGNAAAPLDARIKPAPTSTESQFQPVRPRVELEPRPETDADLSVDKQRPAIDENDLVAALNPVKPDPKPYPVAAPAKEKESPAGIEALFADLDFPDPVDRLQTETNVDDASPEAVEPEDTFEPDEPVETADDIDDMAWPDAAEAVPQTEDDETPPPPEGYDLDAVARAMQESDPTLNGAGVLPPHPTKEQAAIPQARGRSRRGLYVTAGVLAVAALGGAGFFFYDGDSVQVPSGPPPVISGLQEPLKIYPESSQPPATDQQPIKLNYDRVNSTDEAAPERLVVPETPQPVDLPPAPAGVEGTAELAPGAPKRVRTLVVRPDGTIINQDSPEAAASAATGTEQPVPDASAAPAPATIPTAAAPAISTPTVSVEPPRVVETTPVVADPAPAEPVVPPAPEATPAPVETQIETPAEIASAEPAAPTTPAIVAGTEEPVAAVAEPVEEAAAPAPVPTVVPRKKPAAPVQVASAPAAQAAPAATTQRDGPLNLTNTANTQAAAPATSNTTSTSGSIASGTYIVQVTSQRSADAASSAYSSLQQRYPSVLGNRNAVIVSADLGDRGIFYRARIPTGSRDEANSLCESLKGAGGDCFVRRQP